MNYFNVEFAMPGHGGRDEDVREPTGDLKAIMRQASDMLVLKKFPEAIAILEEAIEANPTSEPLHHMLMKAYLDGKRIPEAKRELDRLHELGVKDPNISIWLAATALGMRRFEDAFFYFQEAKTLGAEPGDWCILLGNALWHTGHLSEAEKLYNDMLPICEKSRYDIFVGLMAIRMQEERYREAAELGMHALKCHKPKTRVVYFLGLAFMRMGETEQAIEAFRKFVRMQPNYVAPYRWLERLTRKAGDDAEADAFNLAAREMLEDRRRLRLEKQRGGPG